MKYSREQYLAGEVTHHEYYDQFVNANLYSIVINYIGLDRIVTSKDDYFNDIPLKYWDNMYMIVSNLHSHVTLAESVCITKAAARHIRSHNFKELE